MTQALKYLKIGTCPVSQKLLGYMEKILLGYMEKMLIYIGSFEALVNTSG